MFVNTTSAGGSYNQKPKNTPVAIITSANMQDSAILACFRIGNLTFFTLLFSLKSNSESYLPYVAKFSIVLSSLLAYCFKNEEYLSVAL